MFNVIIFELKYDDYYPYIKNDSEYLDVLSLNFLEPSGWFQGLEEILNKNEKGVCGEWVFMRRQGEDDLEVVSADDPYNEMMPRAIINKHIFFKNIDIWFDLVKKNTPEIALISSEQYPFEIVDRRSRPELYMFDINMRPVDKKEYDFVILKQDRWTDYYDRKLDNDVYLSMLSQLFTYRQKWTDTVEQALRDPDSKGVSYQEANVIIDNEQVTIQPARYYKPEEYAIIIEKQELLKLIEQWNELVAKKVKAIVVKKYPDQKVIIEEYAG